MDYPLTQDDLRPTVITESYESLTDELTRLRHEKAQADQAAQAFQEQADTYKRQLDEYRASESKALREARTNKAKVEELTEEVELLRDSNAMLGNKIATLESQVAHAEEIAEAKVAQRTRALREELEDLKADHAKLEETHKQVKNNLKVLQQRKDVVDGNTKGVIDHYKAQIAHLTKQLRKVEASKVKVVPQYIRVDSRTDERIPEPTSVEEASQRRAALVAQSLEINAELNAWKDDHTPEYVQARRTAQARLQAESGYLKEWIKQRNIETFTEQEREQIDEARRILRMVFEWEFPESNLRELLDAYAEKHHLFGRPEVTDAQED